eukprot:446776-Rhodomonas_salina.2
MIDAAEARAIDSEVRAPDCWDGAAGAEQCRHCRCLVRHCFLERDLGQRDRGDNVLGPAHTLGREAPERGVRLPCRLNARSPPQASLRRHVVEPEVEPDNVDHVAAFGRQAARVRRGHVELHVDRGDLRRRVVERARL